METENLTQEQIEKRERLRQLLAAHTGMSEVHEEIQKNASKPNVIIEKPEVVDVGRATEMKPVITVQETKLVDTPAAAVNTVQKIVADTPVGEALAQTTVNNIPPLPAPVLGEQKPSMGEAMAESLGKVKRGRKKAEQKPVEVPVATAVTESTEDGKVTAAFSLKNEPEIFVSSRACKLCEIGQVLDDIEAMWDSQKLLATTDLTVINSGTTQNAFAVQSKIDELISQLDEKSALLYSIVNGKCGEKKGEQ